MTKRPDAKERQLSRETPTPAVLATLDAADAVWQEVARADANLLRRAVLAAAVRVAGPAVALVEHVRSADEGWRGGGLPIVLGDTKQRLPDRDAVQRALEQLATETCGVVKTEQGPVVAVGDAKHAATARATPTADVSRLLVLATAWHATQSLRPRDVLQLSPIQQATLDRLLAGDTERQIADRFGVSMNTVHSRVKRLYRLHGVRSRTQLLLQLLPIYEKKDDEERDTIFS
jgi:DNA-binding CsgD family transcriptional regulator